MMMMTAAAVRPFHAQVSMTGTDWGQILDALADPGRTLPHGKTLGVQRPRRIRKHAERVTRLFAEMEGHGGPAAAIQDGRCHGRRFQLARHYRMATSCLGHHAGRGKPRSQMLVFQVD